MYGENSLTAEIKRRRCFSRNKSLSENDLTVINASDSERKSRDGSSDSASPPISASDLKKKIYRKMSHGMSFLQNHDKSSSPNRLSPNFPRKVSSDSNISTAKRNENDTSYWKFPLSKKHSSPHKLSPKNPRKVSSESNRNEKETKHLELPTFSKYPNKLSPNLTRKKSSESNRAEQNRIKMTKMDKVEYNDESDLLTENSLRNINYIYSVTYNAKRFNVAKSYCNAVSLDSKYHKECLNELEHLIYELKDGDITASHTIDLEELRRRIETLKEEMNQLKKVKERNELQYKKSSFDLTDNASNVKKLELKNENVNMNIAFLEEKIHKYQKQFNEINEANRRCSNRNIMKAMHDSVKSSVRHRASSFSGVISRPLESLSSFIKKERASCDENDTQTLCFREEYETGLYEQTDDPSPRSLSPLIDYSDNIPRICHEDLSEANHLKTKLLDLEKESGELKDSIMKMKDMLTEMMKTLEEEKYRKEKLQSHLDDVFLHMNSLSEEHEKDATKMKEKVIFTIERIEHMEMNFMERTAELEDSVENCCAKITEIDTENLYVEDRKCLPRHNSVLFLLSSILSLFFNVIFLVSCVFHSLTKRLLSLLPDTMSRILTFGITSFIIYYCIWSLDKSHKEL